MLNITTFRRRNSVQRTQLRVAIIATHDRRALVTRALGTRAQVVGELESSDRAHLLESVQPDIVFIDTASPAINPASAVRQLRTTGVTVPIVLLADRAGDIRSMPGFPAVHPRDAASALPSEPDGTHAATSDHSPVAA